MNMIKKTDAAGLVLLVRMSPRFLIEVGMSNDSKATPSCETLPLIFHSNHQHMSSQALMFDVMRVFESIFLVSVLFDDMFVREYVRTLCLAAVPPAVILRKI